MYHSASRRVKSNRGGTAIFQSVGRLSDNKMPSGSRSNHVYTSPNFKPSSTFNFWNDLTLNQTTRNKWDNKSVTINLTEYSKAGSLNMRVDNMLNQNTSMMI